MMGSPSGPSDRAAASDTTMLLRRAQAGDDHALEHLIRHLGPRLSRWASGRLPDHARDLVETSDLVQEALVNSVRRIPTFAPARSRAFFGYLRQAVLNRMRDELRRVGRQGDRDPMPDDVMTAGPSPLEDLLGREVLDRYDSALARLRVEEREAIVARVELGLEFADVAGMLGKASPDAARMVVNRAMIKLAKEMSRDADR